MRFISSYFCAGLVLCVSLANCFAETGEVQPAGNCANGNCSVGGPVSGGGPVAFGRAGCYGAGCLGNHTFGVSPANCNYRQYGPHDLFRQYYAPNNCGGPTAALYVAPRPVPEHVGHTYYTYQPLYPHEWMYPHHRTYHRYYDDGRGLTRTSVHWMR
jgi:hypothetical protein